MSEVRLCPVCGFADLFDVPWENGVPSDEICPSCGTHFGYDDVAGGDAGRREHVWRELRQRWRDGGCHWFSVGRPAPPGWDPHAQLDAVTS